MLTILFFEFTTGIIFNLLFQLSIWNYSNLPFFPNDGAAEAAGYVLGMPYNGPNGFTHVGALSYVYDDAGNQVFDDSGNPILA